MDATYAARVLRLVLTFSLATALTAQDWVNSGGNAGRNGQSSAYGPLTAQLAWSGSRPSIIAWQPVTAGDRVFLVRQTGFPPNGEPNGSPVVCHDLVGGAERWITHVPYNTGDWTTWVLGASNGKVYASRAGNGASVSARVYALDQGTGGVAWISTDVIDAGAYDGVVFADNGDLIVGSFRKIWRIRASDGTTAWTATRVGSVSGSCGVARFGTALYAADAAAGGTVLKRFDVGTGALQYASPVMTGFTIQQTPMVGPDGTVYLNRSQNNATTDFFYAFDDTGTAFVQRWRVASQWTTNSEFAVGTDGAVYMLQPGEILTALDPATGAVRATYPVPLGAANPRIAVDGDGRLFVSNGGFGTGRVFSFNQDLTLRWSAAVANINIGGPVLAGDGTLVVAGVGGDLRAYRTPSPWSDVGGGLAGPNGLPRLRGSGTMTAGHDIGMLLDNARANSVAVFVLGTSAVHLPLFGGTLVPSPDLVFPPLPTSGQGTLDLALRFPFGVPPGTSFWMQHWIADPAAAVGLTASNGLRGVSP